MSENEKGCLQTSQLAALLFTVVCIAHNYSFLSAMVVV